MSDPRRPPVLPPPSVPPTAHLMPDHVVPNDACIKRLEQLQVRPGRQVYPATAEPGTLGSETLIQTNVFGIDVQSELYVYHYSVHIKTELPNKKEVVFTKKGKEDFVVTERREKCCAVFADAVIKNREFFLPGEGNCLVYDGQSILFATTDFFAGYGEGETKTKVFEVNGANVSNKDLEQLPCIKLEVFPTKNPPIKFNSEDMARRGADANIESINRAYNQVIELALNQAALTDTARCIVFENGKLFFLTPARDGFDPEDCIDVGDGKKMFPGIKKTVQFIEGPDGRSATNPSVVIDGMKVAFHKEQTVLEKIAEITGRNVGNTLLQNREYCSAIIKGLGAYHNYSERSRQLRIEGIHGSSARGCRFELNDGGTSSVMEYYKDKYDITLQYPELNLLVCKVRGNDNFFPMELVYIAPHQRVTISQQTSSQSQRTTKESAVLPDVRQRLTMVGKAAARINNENDVLSGLGLFVHPVPLVVKARQLPPAKITCQANSQVQLKDNKWRINRYTRPADAPTRWALYCVGSNTNRFDHALLKKFGEEFVAMLKSKGVQMPGPEEIDLAVSSNIGSKLLRAAEGQCQFVFIITDDSITDLHLKYKIFELEHKMIIQDMKTSRALSVITQGKKLTLENVVHKTNVKLGGTNYIFTDVKRHLDGVLLIGIGLSRPTVQTSFITGKDELNPTIVGYAYNGVKNQEFSGDFVLSSAKQDTLSPVETIVTQAITAFKNSRREAPRVIIVYRSGASDGNHGSIMSFEIPLAYASMEKDAPNAKLVYIVVSKDHTCRFFKPDLNNIVSRGSGSGSQGNRDGPRACDLNIGPGISVDSEVTNPGCKQFYLNSHITLQGSAKTPLYTVLKDDTNVSMNKLMELTYNLCHLHQIVGLPTSLPTPLYVANEYAKRGRNMFADAYKKHREICGAGPETERLRNLTNAMNYTQVGDLSNRRLNA